MECSQLGNRRSLILKSENGQVEVSQKLPRLVPIEIRTEALQPATSLGVIGVKVALLFSALFPLCIALIDELGTSTNPVNALCYALGTLVLVTVMVHSTHEQRPSFSIFWRLFTAILSFLYSSLFLAH
jgi:hypothetical protein